MMKVEKRKIVKFKKVLSLLAVCALGIVVSPAPSKADNEYTALGINKFENLMALDNGDYAKFRDRMDAAKWNRTGAFSNYDVYYTDMTKYGNESDITYITSHGSTDGSIALSEYADRNPSYYARKYINYNLVGGDGNLKGGPDGVGQDAEWFIFASCYSLNQKYWAQQVSNRVHYLLGYRGLSEDYTDTSIINNFLDRAWGSGWRNPETIFSAWINANRAYNEYDWAIIGHQNNRMDYIHGVETGATADQSSNSDVKRWSGNGTANVYTEDLSAFTKSINQVKKGSSNNDIRFLAENYNGNIKTKNEKLNIKKIKNKLLGKNLKTGFDEANEVNVSSSDLGTLEVFKNNSFIYSREINNDKISKSQDDVIVEIEKFIEQNGGFRNDLTLSKILPMTAEDEKGNSVTTGYTIEYKQKLEDTIIDSSVSTGIVIGYDSNGINFYMRDVKDIVKKEKVHNKKVKKPEDIYLDVIEKKKDNYKSDFSPEFKEMSMVYYANPYNEDSNILIPAYKVTVDNSNSIFVDAKTGEVLNGGKSLQDSLGDSNNKINTIPITKETPVQQFAKEE